jgi:hypothetical protein
LLGSSVLGMSIDWELADYLWTSYLDTLTLWNGVVIPSHIGIPILVVFGVWIGGLLAATVWRIGRSAGSIAAIVVAAMIGVASVPMTTELIWYVAATQGGWVYQWFQNFAMATIASAIFWVVFLVGIRSGLSLQLGLCAGGFLLAPIYFSVESSVVLVCAFLLGWPVGIVAATCRACLKASLPKQRFRELFYGSSDKPKTARVIE